MSATASSFTKEHVPGLDALRGLAVLMILWTHAAPGILGQPIEVLRGMVQPGYLGVDLFFVLSGFLITRILLVDKERGHPLRWFLLRRVLRIFPIYYLVVATVAFVKPGPELPWCALYVSNFYFPFHHEPSLLRHSWSLAVEEHFYLLWPLAVYVLPTRKAMLAAIALIPFAIACAIGVILLGRESGLHWISAHLGESASRSFDPKEIVYMGTMFRAESLALGALLAFAEPAIERRPVRAFVLALLGGLAAVMLVRGSSPLGDTRWIPLTDLVGFTVLSGASVLGLIAAHYVATSESLRAQFATRFAPTWPRIGFALIVHGLLEAALFVGLRWVFSESESSWRVAGLFVASVSVLGLLGCAAYWVSACSRRLRTQFERAGVAECWFGVAIATALAAIVSIFGWRLRLGTPSVVVPAFLAVAALLLAITSLQRLASAADSPAPLPDARSSRLALAGVAATLFVGAAVLSCRCAAPGWSALDSVARAHFGMAAAIYLVILLFTLRAANSVGRISYGLYLYHLPIYILLGVRSGESTLSRQMLLALAVLVTFTVATLSYRLLERPILRWAQRFR